MGDTGTPLKADRLLPKISPAKAMCATLGLAAGLLIATRPATAALSTAAWQALGLLVWAICFWIGQIWDDYVVALTMAVGWIVLRVVPFEQAFATFHSKTWWLMVGALGLGAAVAGSGLLRRSTLLMLRVLPGTYLGQTLALTLTGILACPAIPSVIAKVSITGQFIPELSQGMGFADRSKASAGLFMAMFLGFVLAAPMYLTATSANMFLVELLPAAEQARMTWLSWLLAAAPPTLLAVTAGFCLNFWLFAPKTAATTDRGLIEQQLRQLGPLNRAERITSGVLVAAILLWVTESWHGLQPATVALLALIVLLATGVLQKGGFQRGIGWSSLIFLGVILNLGTVFPALGIDKFLGGQVMPVLSPLAAHPVVFIALLMLVVVLLRFIIVSINALLAILMLVLIPLVSQLGISAWALGMTLHYASHAIWFLPYQNITYAIGIEATGGRSIQQRDAALFSLGFTVITILSVIVCLPYWRSLGLIG